MKIFILCLLIFTASFGEPIQPIPMSLKTDAKKVLLGKELFSDTLLSRDNTISCASCHDLSAGGDDGLRFSFGIEGKQGNINSPTVYNAVFNFRQFWNGRAKDLADQASGPIENPVEMGNTFENLIPVLEKSHYKKQFALIYKDGITKANIVDAIAEFEKTLITPNTPFDLYLKGDENAITQEQKEGYELFKSKGCISCHNGVGIGGNLYNKFGVMKETASKRTGRYEVTKRERDKYYFKVPSLRNVALTAPYLHDGRYENLEDVVKFMSRYQLGQIVKQDEIDKIVSFLESLSYKKAE